MAADNASITVRIADMAELVELVDAAREWHRQRIPATGAAPIRVANRLSDAVEALRLGAVTKPIETDGRLDKLRAEWRNGTLRDRLLKPNPNAILPPATRHLADVILLLEYIEELEAELGHRAHPMSRKKPA